MSPMNKQSERQRAIKAAKEMKSMGFPMKKVKTVLKDLLMMFDNNWEMIENENYSVLVDSLISSDDAKVPLGDKADLEIGSDNDDDIGAELCRKKRSQKRKLDDRYLLDGPVQDVVQTHPMTSTVLMITDDCSKIQNYVCEVKGKGVAFDCLQGKIICPVSPRSLPMPRDNMIRVERSCPLVHYKDPESDDKSSDFPPGSPRFEPPIAMIHPSSPFTQIEGQRQSGKVSVGTSGDAIMQAGRNLETRNAYTPDQGSDETGIADLSHSAEIASSPNGKIKMVFSWDGLDENFQMPSLDTILKMVEDRCLKSFKFLQPNFSLMNIMTEMCQTALELGVHGEETNYTNRKAASGKSSNTNYSGLVAARQHEPSLGDVRPRHDASDITKGEERLKITVANDVSCTQYPPSFFYISHNIVYQNGHVNFSLARIGDGNCCSDCSGDCLSASIPCTCARETGGEFAYNCDGVMKDKFLDDYIANFHRQQNHHLIFCKDCPLERSMNDIAPDPCRGHLGRRFIKECWVKCGCNKLCGNRVVQRGITQSLQVFFAGDSKGWGLRTLEELPRGAFVCEYVGEILTIMELYNRKRKIIGNVAHSYPVLLDADWGTDGILKDENSLCLDAAFYGNVARFINHRCNDANLIEIPVEIETVDHHYYHLAFFTTRKVQPLEELTWDYGIDFDAYSHPIESFACKCGSKYCRDLNRYSRSNRKALAMV